MTQRQPPLARPLPCVVLGIDPGARSGWAVLTAHGGRLALGPTGESRGADPEAIEHARSLAEALGQTLVVVREHWQGAWARGRRSARTQAGLGASWGEWRYVLRQAGHPERRTLSVGQSTWRAAVLGGQRARKTVAWKAAARGWCRAQWGIELGTDAAEAACVAAWAMRSRRVATVLPARVRRELGLEER